MPSKNDRIYVRVNKETKNCLIEFAEILEVDLSHIIKGGIELYLNKYFNDVPDEYIYSLMRGYYKDLSQFFDALTVLEYNSKLEGIGYDKYRI